MSPSGHGISPPAGGEMSEGESSWSPRWGDREKRENE